MYLYVKYCHPCFLCSGPLAGALVNKYGCRPVTIAGSIIAAVFFFASSFSPNIGFMMFSYGLMGGLSYQHWHSSPMTAKHFVYFRLRSAVEHSGACCYRRCFNDMRNAHNLHNLPSVSHADDAWIQNKSDSWVCLGRAKKRCWISGNIGGKK